MKKEITKQEMSELVDSMLDVSFGYAFEFWPDNKTEEQFKNHMKGFYQALLLIEETLKKENKNENIL